jgi:hypothetical protein
MIGEMRSAMDSSQPGGRTEVWEYSATVIKGKTVTSNTINFLLVDWLDRIVIIRISKI